MSDGTSTFDSSTTDPALIPYIIAWNTLLTLALVLLCAIVLTVLLSSIRRSSTWILFISSVVLTTVSYLLLVTRQLGPDPPRTLCLIQAMLLYACPVLNAASSFSFMLQSFLLIAPLRRSQTLHLPSTINFWLLTAPVVAFCAILLEVFLVDLYSPSDLGRDLSRMYCSMTRNRIPIRVSGGIVATYMTAVLVLQVVVFLKLRRDWNRHTQTLAGSNISPRILLRFVIFGLFSVVAMGISFAFAGTTIDSYTHKGAALSNIALALMSLAAALIFGTQRDILGVWMFWRKSPSR